MTTLSPTSSVTASELASGSAFGRFGSGDGFRVTGAALTSRQRDFATVLGTEQRRVDAAKLTPEQEAREAAEGLVAIALVQPLLAAARESSNAAEPFAPTEAEERFGSLIDADRARQLVRSGRFGIVDRLARDLLQQTRALEARDAMTPAVEPVVRGKGPLDAHL